MAGLPPFLYYAVPLHVSLASAFVHVEKKERLLVRAKTLLFRAHI